MEKGVRNSANGSILVLGSGFRLTRTWAREGAAALKDVSPELIHADTGLGPGHVHRTS